MSLSNYSLYRSTADTLSTRAVSKKEAKRSRKYIPNQNERERLQHLAKIASDSTYKSESENVEYTGLECPALGRGLRNLAIGIVEPTEIGGNPEKVSIVPRNEHFHSLYVNNLMPWSRTPDSDSMIGSRLDKSVVYGIIVLDRATNGTENCRYLLPSEDVRTRPFVELTDNDRLTLQSVNLQLAKSGNPQTQLLEWNQVQRHGRVPPGRFDISMFKEDVPYQPYTLESNLPTLEEVRNFIVNDASFTQDDQDTYDHILGKVSLALSQE
ncbi:hypothetical protein CI109_103754 [Kwoniella shandongensis]|uniref:Uncharacterized protein n=1 Tax=Kwoniella shandongensis TaxID=1734106 RepID=A0A5M6C775_9TREE|nr:uncharacterized protein CI109_000550 [Kwoniella shandongensis]KAA5530978.1 hypothetical protein CI109_000550 [Kwoniella shandongensis]